MSEPITIEMTRDEANRLWSHSVEMQRILSPKLGRPMPFSKKELAKLRRKKHRPKVKVIT